MIFPFLGGEGRVYEIGLEGALLEFLLFWGYVYYVVQDRNVMSLSIERGPGIIFMKRLNLGADKREGGYLIVDLLIASVLLAVGIMVFFSSFATMGKGTLASKKKSVANTLAQEKMESLKGLTYHQLLATTNAVEDLNFPPSSRYRYDADRGTETLMEGGGSYLRRMLVTKSSETASGDSLSLPIGSVRDFGLKEIVVYVVWEENGDWKRFDLSGQIRNRDRKKMSAKVQGTLSVPTAPVSYTHLIEERDDPGGVHRNLPALPPGARFERVTTGGLTIAIK